MIGRTKQAIIRFLDRAHGRVHDAVLSKFLNAYFATLPESNALSLRSNKKRTEKLDFARKIDRETLFYAEDEYSEA